MAGSGTDPIEGQELSRNGQSTFGELEACEMPVVAGIDGYCLGGGMELATCTDLRVASERSEFGQPELDLGSSLAGVEPSGSAGSLARESEGDHPHRRSVRRRDDGTVRVRQRSRG